MSEMQDYKSSLDDPASRKFETFSYLLDMDQARIKKQVAYIVSKGWNPAIEHTEPENAVGHYWYMWKLPMFGETDVNRILAQTEACHKTYPSHHVRLVGYDNDRSQALPEDQEIGGVSHDSGRLAKCPQCGRLGYQHMPECPYNQLPRARTGE